MSDPPAPLQPPGEPESPDALRASELTYRALVEMSHDLIWSVDAQGRWTFVNGAARRIYGYEPAEMLGRTFMEFETPDQAEKDLGEFARIKAGTPAFNYETVHLRKDGTPVHLSFNAVFLRDAQGTVLGTTGTAQNITERKRAEAALRRSQARLVAAERVAHTGNWTYEVATGTIEWSDGMWPIYGRAPMPEALTYEALLAMVHPDDRPSHDAYLAGLKELVPDSPAVPKFEYRLLRPDGSERTVEVSCDPEFDEQGRPARFFGTVQDITERRKLEGQLLQSQRMDSIGQLAGGVAHDFNNILTVIQGHVTLLDAQPAASPVVRESVSEIKQAAERAANLTRQLLTFSRRQAIRPDRLDLNGVVTNMARLLQRILGEDIRMDLHLSSYEMVVLADAGMMEQVLLNLAVNSRDAMPRGGVLQIKTAAVDFDDTITARLPQARAGAFVCLSAADTGTGIPAHILPRIFEPFFTTKALGKGTGLGLATIYGIVQQHEGWIVVDSECGRGTTFHLYLPRKSGLANVTPPPDETVVRGGRETILLVEDEQAVRVLVTSLLERVGYRVYAAANGPLALELWREHAKEISLLITDLVMPDGLSGFDLGAQLTRDAPQLRVIYTSGYSPEFAARGETLIPGVNFLAKPFEVQALRRVIRAALDQAQA